jgi:hypothetical protein
VPAFARQHVVEQVEAAGAADEQPAWPGCAQVGVGLGEVVGQDEAGDVFLDQVPGVDGSPRTSSLTVLAEFSMPVGDPLPQASGLGLGEAVGGEFAVGVDGQGGEHLGEHAAVESGVSCGSEGKKVFPGVATAGDQGVASMKSRASARVNRASTFPPATSSRWATGPIAMVTGGWYRRSAASSTLLACPVVGSATHRRMNWGLSMSTRTSNPWSC